MPELVNRDIHSLFWLQYGFKVVETAYLPDEVQLRDTCKFASDACHMPGGAGALAKRGRGGVRLKIPLSPDFYSARD